MLFLLNVYGQRTRFDFAKIDKHMRQNLERYTKAIMMSQDKYFEQPGSKYIVKVLIWLKMIYEIDIKSKRIYNGVCGCQWTQKDHCGRQKFEGHYPNVILIIKYCFTIKEFQWNWNVRIGYDGTSTSVCNILLKLYLTCKNYYSHNIGFLYIRVTNIL